MIKKWTEVFQDDGVKRVIMDNDSYTYKVTTRKLKEILIQNNPVAIVKKKIYMGEIGGAQNANSKRSDLY